MSGKKIATYLTTAAVALVLTGFLASTPVWAGDQRVRIKVGMDGVGLFDLASGEAKWERRPDGDGLRCNPGSLETQSRCKISVQGEDIEDNNGPITGTVTIVACGKTYEDVPVTAGGIDFDRDTDLGHDVGDCEAGNNGVTVVFDMGGAGTIFDDFIQ